MAVRIRYRRTELFEGEIETIKEATDFEIMEDNTIHLVEKWIEVDEDDPDNEDLWKRKSRKVGFVHRDRWDSIVRVEEKADA